VFEGAVQDTGSWAFWLDVTVTPVGAPGVVAGKPVTEGLEAAEVPAPFVAVTLTAYCTPFASVLMVHVVLGGVAVQVRVVWPEAVAVAVYPLMAEPLFAGALQLTGSCESRLEVTETPVGASGEAAGVPLADGVEAVLVPSALVAVTVTA
jgi:hypothetical protein